MVHFHSLIISLSFSALCLEILATEAQLTPRQIVRETSSNGCRMNICFALDGSNRVSRSDFGNFREFVGILVRRLSKMDQIQVAGVQYGFVTHPISPLTSDTRLFRQLLRDTDFEEADFTRVSGGMVYCFGQLRSPPVLLPKTRIVILGSGQAELGVDPEFIAELFRELGGKIFGIGVDNASATNLAGFLGTSNNVFTLPGGSRATIQRFVGNFIPILCRD